MCILTPHLALTIPLFPATIFDFGCGFYKKWYTPVISGLNSVLVLTCGKYCVRHAKYVQRHIGMKRLCTSLAGRKDPTRVPMRSCCLPLNVANCPAGEAYNCSMLPAGISNSANSCYISAVLQCLFNHPSFPSLFNQLFF